MGDEGGIIILFTTGSDNDCTAEDELEPVASSRVRLINVAFGAGTDANLAELATETNGLSYTVETSGKYRNECSSISLTRIQYRFVSYRGGLGRHAGHTGIPAHGPIKRGERCGKREGGRI